MKEREVEEREEDEDEDNREFISKLIEKINLK